jgi:hypothetical protein
MTLDKAIFTAFVINILIYISAIFFLSCHDGGFISFCSSSGINLIIPFYLFFIQFTAYDLDGHLFSYDYSNRTIFIIIWVIVLLPFLFWFLTKDQNESKDPASTAN